jgi:hypothetical protein
MKFKSTLVSFIVLLLCGTSAFAQPAVLNGNNYPPVGYTDTIAGSGQSLVPSGSAGANVTWDFSSVVAVKGGMFEVVDPVTTPYTSSYPGANKSLKFTVLSNSSYQYTNLSASKYELIADNVTATTGSNYTPNPKTSIPIPFNYMDVVIDTFQKVGSPVGTVVITYDGYGTLITPFLTLNNIIRSKRDFGGSDFYYEWYSVSPRLFIVGVYDNNSQKYTFLGTTPVGIADLKNESASVKVYPNPATDNSVIRISSNIKKGNFVLSDISGKVVKEIQFDNNSITLNRDGMAAGLYSFVIVCGNEAIAKGRLTLQ